MKKLFALLAVVLAVVSCQKDVDNLNVNVDGKQETVVTVTLPEVTRAASDLSGWENEKGTLNVIFQVYDENGKTTEQMRQTGTIAYDTKSVNFNVRLVPNRKYTFVAWADQGDYFDTRDLEKVTFKANTWNAMSEVRDAYTATKTVEAATSIPAITLELTRPFAKVRVVTTDIKAVTNLGLALKDGSVTYSTALPNSFNVVAGKVNDATEVKEHAINYQTDVYDDNAGEKTLFTDYVLIPEDGVVNFTLTVNDMAKEITTVTFNTDIPVERNKLTTIKGNILTGNTDVNIKVEDEFKQPGIERPYVEVNSVAELQEAIENAEEGKETTIVLGENIDLGLGGIILATRAEEPGFGIKVPKGKDIILDLGGKTLSMNKECTKHFSMIENNGNLTITGNGKISFKDTGAGDPNFSWGSYTVSNYGGNLVIENGTIEHLGEQNQGNGQPNCHMYCAVFQYSGSTTINGGKISTPTYRSARLWNGDMTINGGEFTGQVWFQCVSDGANLTINNGTFAPRGNDGSSVFVNNSSKNVTFAVNGGTFNGKIGMDAPYACITGGTFTEEAKNGTNAALLAACHYFEKVGENYVVKGVNQVNGVYQISSKADLFWFANEVNVNKNTFNGQTIKLVADIDLNNEEWTPIGSAYEDHGFMGNFDGNGYIIKNLKITKLTPDADGYVYAGLFGVTEGVDKDNENYIKNLTIENVTIATTGHIVAAAVAYPYYTNLENITVKGNVNIKGGDYTAGVLAYTRRCVNAKNISIEGNEGSVIEGNNTVGGVISDIQMNGGLTANYSNFAASGLTIKAAGKCLGGISGIISLQALDGATVKNVALVCNDDRTGIVAGADGGKHKLTNVTYENVTGATRIVGATYDKAYYVGKVVEAAGQKAVVFCTENGVKAVSVAELNLNGKNWQDAMDWAAGLGEGWALASMEDLNAIYDLRFELNDVLEADNAENALFWEGDELYKKNGSVYYALYMSSTEIPVGGADANGNKYFENRVFFKIFNKLGYSDVLYSAFDCINKYAPLRDNHFARGVISL